jgi:phage/plasmid-associated DNA primase
VALQVFSTNVLPNFTGGIDGGVIRRLLPLQFNGVVPEARRVPGLARLIAEEEPDLLLELAVQGAVRLIQQRDFTVPTSAKALLAEWALASDPVRAWAKDRLEEANPLEVGPTDVTVLYGDFQRWAEQRRMRLEYLPSNIAFGKRVYAAAPWLQRLRSDGSKVINARLRDGSS